MKNKHPSILSDSGIKITLKNLFVQAGFSAYAAGFKRGYKTAVTGKPEPSTKELEGIFQAELDQNSQS